MDVYTLFKLGYEKPALILQLQLHRKRLFQIWSKANCAPVKESLKIGLDRGIRRIEKGRITLSLFHNVHNCLMDVL